MMTTTSPSNPSAEQEVSMFPTSFAQQRLWFLDQLEPNSPAYNIFSTLQINGLLDVELLKQSLQVIIERHEVLRTIFAISEGQPMQVIAPTSSVPLTVIDLQQLPEEEREAEVLRQANQEAQRPFDLAQGPLLRTTLLRLRPEEHVLLVCIHHIIFDGWSNGVFFRELETLYSAFVNGYTAQLPELPIQYTDFTLWQREWLQGEMLEEQLAYWKQQLADAPTVLELPTDHPRPSVPSNRGASCLFTLPSSLSEALKLLSRQHRVSLFMTLTAAFQALLHRYTGQDDLLLGTVTADRSQEGTKNLMGFFVNTLVLRADLSGNPSFKELLTRVRKTVLEAHAHQDMPFEYLVKELHPERSLGQNPFFQVMVVLEPPDPHLTSGWVLKQMDFETGTAKFDLGLKLQDLPEGLVGRLEYRTDLFEEATIRRMIVHWQTLLEALVAHPEQQISELPILTEAERQQLLVEWNATVSDYPKEQTVHQLFEAQVQRTPDAVALVMEEQQMTYRELNQRANQLAHHLQHLGVGPDVLVGLCMDRSLDLVVSLLGILKAGGAYVPLDPSYPQERLTFMLRDTQAPVLITQQRFINAFPTQPTHLLCLDAGWSTLSKESTENLKSGATTEQLAYVMYTSGSTGRPKGVEIRHRSILRLLFGIDYTRLDATRTILHMAPISFDAATFEVWGALLHGGRCVLFPERVPIPKAIGAAIRKHHATTIWLTTALFNAVIDEAPEALLEAEHVLTGGEAVSLAHIRRALEALPNTLLTNCYGPTETTTFATSYPIPRQLSETIRSVPIGRPIGNTQVYILDRYGNPVPIGVAGELHIGGAGVARGYLHRPELTTEKFIADPFSDVPDAKLYKTGDLVRYLPDGSIEFLGRTDHQVKIRGFRIEPGEIEVVLGQHPAVREALIAVCESERGDKRFVAYVVPLEQQQVTITELRSFLKERLPEYMIPSDFLLLESMPVTPNGKVDRRALPEPQQTSQRVAGNVGGSLLTVHHLLKQIWENLLGVQAIGIEENFFELGGHSLLAARLMDRIEQATGKKLALSTLYAGATIEHLAEVLLEQTETDRQAEVGKRAVVVAVQASGSRRPFFFLHGDWFGGGFYCLTLAKSLGSEQPFYALEPYNFEGMAIPPSMEQMAAAHIKAMRAIQPEGPYLLGGFCNGGLVAYEMARQLHAAGQQVELLALIDVARPTPHKWVRKAIRSLGKVLLHGEDKQVDWFLRYLYKRIPAYQRKVDASKDLSEQLERERTAGKAKRGLGMKWLDAQFPSTAALRYQWYGIYRWIAAGYVPGSYLGKLTLFWSSQARSRQVNWRQISGAKEVEDFVLPGTHMSCKNENLPILAERLAQCLMRCKSS